MRRTAALMVAAGILVSFPGCESDDAVERDARDAAPTVEEAGEEAKDEAGEAGRAIEKEIED